MKQVMLEVSRYIHLNPVDAEMVKKLAAYRWRSYLYFDDHDPPHIHIRGHDKADIYIQVQTNDMSTTHDKTILIDYKSLFLLETGNK